MRPTTGRFKSVDILRSAAVLLVLGRHLPVCPENVNPILRNVYVVWHRGGWVGVDVFFVLSGFLVSGLLFREHEKFGCISAKDFLVRRGLKIYPAFWVLIAATIVTGILTTPRIIHNHYWRKGIICELLFVQNYGFPIWWHTWSLAIEEHFYLLLLLFLLVLSRYRPGAKAFQAVPATAIFLVVVCLALRLLTSARAPYDQSTHLYATHLRLDSLFAGVFVSYLYHNFPQTFLSLGKRFRSILLVIGILLLTPAFIFQLETTPFIYTLGLTLFYTGSVCLLVAAIVTNLPRQPLLDGLAYLGSHSYSIYLWHIPLSVWLFLLLQRLLGNTPDWPLQVVLYFSGSLILGVLLALLIEFPVLRLRDRWFPSRARPLTTGTQARRTVGTPSALPAGKI